MKRSGSAEKEKTVKRTVMELKMRPSPPGDTPKERARRFSEAESRLRYAQHCQDRLDELDAAGGVPASVTLNFNVPGRGDPLRGVTVKESSGIWPDLVQVTREAFQREVARSVEAIQGLGFGVDLVEEES